MDIKEVLKDGVAVAVTVGVLGWLFTPADPKFNRKPPKVKK